MPRELRRIPYRGWLLIGFLILFGLSTIGVEWGRDFVLQHVLTITALAVLVVSGIRKPFDNISYSLLFLFMCLHLLGGHYFYSFVPYDDWTQSLFGFRLNELFGWERNHYDRFVHFLSGVFLFHPMREIATRWLRVTGWRSYVVAFFMHTSMGGIYELMEGMVAVTFDPHAAEVYNGQQGDMWDAHKDMALAMLGTCCALMTEAAIEQRRAARRVAVHGTVS